MLYEGREPEETDVMIDMGTWQVPFATSREKIEALSYLSVLREDNLPPPMGIGTYLALCNDDELRHLVKLISHAVKRGGCWCSSEGRDKAAGALEVLAFFHHVKCRGTVPCLGREIAGMMERLDRED